jgi:hypothetical protein
MEISAAPAELSAANMAKPETVDAAKIYALDPSTCVALSIDLGSYEKTNETTNNACWRTTTSTHYLHNR